MGFTLQLILGLCLVVSKCGHIETSFLRQVRQVKDIPTINASRVLNVTEINNRDLNKITKDTPRIEEIGVKQKQNSVKFTIPSEENSTKETKSSEKTSSNLVEIEKNKRKDNREESARAIDIDIEKYISDEFHSKNNVFTLPSMSDTEKFFDEFDFPTTSHEIFHINSELTTPRTEFFDQKYKQAVDSVEQKLDDSEEFDEEIEDSKEDSMEPMEDHDHSNISDLFVKTKKIINKKTGDKNSVHKNIGMERRRNLNFVSSYNETKVFDDTTDINLKGDKDRFEVTTPRNNYIQTTRKSTGLTKPPSNENNSHILNNKIEKEMLKATSSLSYTEPSSTIPKITTVRFRGDHGNFTTTTPNPTTVQDNQVIPFASSTTEEATVLKSEETETSFSSPIGINITKTSVRTTSNKDGTISTIRISNSTIVKDVHQLETMTLPESTTSQPIAVITLIRRKTTTTPEPTTVTPRSKLKPNASQATTASTLTKPVTFASKLKPNASQAITVSTLAKPETFAVHESTNDTISTTLKTSASRDSTTSQTATDRTSSKLLSSTSQESTTATTSRKTETSQAATVTTPTKFQSPVSQEPNAVTRSSTLKTSAPQDLTMSQANTVSTLGTLNSSVKTLPQESTTSQTDTVTTTETVETAASQESTTETEAINTVTEQTTDALTSSDEPETTTASVSNKRSSKSFTVHFSSTTQYEMTTEFFTDTSIPITTIADGVGTTNHIGEYTTIEDIEPISEHATERSTGSLKDPIISVIMHTTSTIDRITSVPPQELTPSVRHITTETVLAEATTLREVVKTNESKPEVTEPSNIKEIEFRYNADPNVSTTEEDDVTTYIPPTGDGLTKNDSNGGTIAAIVISTVGAVCLVLLAGLLYIMRKRQKGFNYGPRCRPVSLDDYSIDNVSVFNSVRRKAALRASKRSYGNPAFEDPASISHPLNFPALAKFAANFEDIKAEFEEIPQISARTSELPEGCETKNRYANVIPLPETRVFITPIEGYPNSDYINANYVTGPKDIRGYYIACQGPMQNTVDDFWRMVWEQQSKVILMLTHLFENGAEKCVDYLPPSEVLDCNRIFGDFQITLKKREVKEKYIISIIQLKNMVSNSWREVTHFWYLGWPEKGVPEEANSLIAFLIEARSYMRSSSLDRKEANGNLHNGSVQNELNPVVVHCSPGTGRTGVVIACDIAIREFEQTRLVDIPKIVYRIRRDRANAVQTKEQYQFIYKVVSLYATKLTGGALDSF